MTTPPVPPPSDQGARALRILGLVVLGGVVLCGVAGSCLLLVTLVAPLFSQ